MNEELRLKVEFMVENYNKLKKEFTWEANLIKQFAAMTCSTRGEEVRVDKIKEVKNYIKEETSWTSQFRGVNQFMLSTLLSFEEDYRSTFNDMQLTYEKMRTAGFSSSVYLPLATYAVVKEADRGDWEYTIGRMNGFYRNMKKKSFLVNSSG